MVRKKVGIFTLAFGLIAIGSLLFAQNFIELPIKELHKYWPVLLICLGIEIIVYMLLYNNKDEKVKISIDGFSIAFIIIVAMISNGYGEFKSFSIKGIGDIPFIKDLKFSHELEEKITRTDISKHYNIKELKIRNSFGDIEIKPGNSNSISFDAKIRVRYNDEAKAKNYIDDAIKVVQGEVTEIYVRDLSQYEARDYSSAMVDFIVYIPENINVDVKNSFGNVEVEGGGKTVIKNSNGDIKIHNISKNVDAKTSFGNINIDEVKGNIKAVSSNGNIVILAAKGDIEGKTSFGNIRLDEESIKNGKILAETSFGEIRGFDDLTAEDSDHSKTIEGILGNGSRDVKLKTSNGDIEVR